MIATTQAVALASEKITARPLNLSAGDVPVVLYRDGQAGRVSAFDRRVQNRALLFVPNTNANRPLPVFIDSETKSGWSAEGAALDGWLGRSHARLEPVPVEEGLYWGVMSFWFPSLTWADPAAAH
jgi:hypothetical protein